MPPPRQNPVRRPHSKSRTGCRVCKARRVKCDEARPSCQRCLTHGVQCDFLLEAESSTASRSQDGSSPREAMSIHQLTTPSIPESRLSTWYTIEEMELLHHYTTSTCLSLASDPSVRNFWRVNVPQMGFEHHYVLKGILALAALHLARLRPNQRNNLVEQALIHHSASSYMVMPLITAAHAGSNFTPIFYFSILTTIITFARPRDQGNFLLISNGILPEWLLISRGISTLIESKGEEIFDMSNLGPLLHSGKEFHMLWEAQVNDHDGLKELEMLIRDHLPAGDPRVEILSKGILDLKRCFSLCEQNSMNEELRMRAIFIWLIAVPDGFIDLLKTHSREALCVLAFYCVLLRRVENYWWLEGWSFHLIERIYSTLDDRSRLWIRWPLEEIGWAP
ncbi:hypothetical protein F5Y16DRAFT_367509 [Xylariaceae sp. FL0255]|nr:hypothetical protein F5Y16DRAFT_367509 [Xylariaceae sp. FL0255]